MEFSENQQLLIHGMIQQHSESIRDFYGDAPGYDIFLQNRQITPEKEIEINKILKIALELDPTIDEGFNKPELLKIKNNFDTNNKKSQKLKRDFQTYKRRLSYKQPRLSTHKMNTRSNKKKSSGKTKKKKKKNKKKKRKSYKK